MNVNPKQALKHTMNGFAILSHEIMLNADNPDYQNEHFKGEVRNRLKRLEKEIDELEKLDKSYGK